MIQEIIKQISIKHLKNNVLFLLSGLCLSGLCFSLLVICPGKLSMVISVASLITVGFISTFFENVVSKFKQSSTVLRIFSLILSLVFSIILAKIFIKSWQPSSKVERLASLCHLSSTALLFVLAGILTSVALFFITLTFDFALIEIKKVFIDTVQFSKPKAIISNISKNVLLIISAFALMGLNIKISRSGIPSFLLSYVLIVIVFSQVTNIVKKIREIPLSIKVYSFISSIGICYYARSIFIGNISLPSRIIRLCEKINLNPLSFIRWFTFAVALLSVAVVFVLVSLLLNHVVSKFKTVFRSVSKVEIILYALFATALTGFVCFTFLNSNAFWGTTLKYDIIYTSDSPNLVNNNVYLRLYHPENDLRQPLFAVFAAPFIGFGYALSVPLSRFDPVFTPLFMNVVQVIMLLVANLMLARIINLDAIGRVCFMLFSTVTYTTLLFSIMMEQYIVAYFWLIFAIYSYIENKKASVISLSGAGGTLLTSLILIPTAYKNESKINAGKLRSFVTAIEKSILGFLVILFAFGRLDILLNFSEITTQLLGFAGGESIVGRIKQYLSFVSSCFIAPDAVVDKITYDHISWQLSKSVISQINIIGILIIVLCFISFIVNRENTLTKISALWVCFSVLLLCIVGWGSVENGMILYSLYFGWAYIVLLFQLMNWCSQKLKLKYLTPVISGIAIITMAILNFQGIRELLFFAFTNYPV